MRDLIDWLPVRTRAFLVMMLLALIAAALIGGYLASLAFRSGRPEGGTGAIRTATPTVPMPTATTTPGNPYWRLVWTVKGEGNQTEVPQNLGTPASNGVLTFLLVWTCSASASLPDGGTYLDVTLLQSSSEWPEASLLCPTYGNGVLTASDGAQGAILTLAPFSVQMTSNTRWTLSVELPTATL